MTTTPNHLKWPAGADHTAVPYSVFNSKEVYELEQEKIYNGATWNYLASEAELPDNGSFKSTYIGDTPVVVTRGQDGEIYAWVNRCAHRGAEICRERHGKSEDGAYTCVYHQWAFDAEGDLRGVPFQRGLAGKGGMPKDFDKKKHSLRKVRVVNYHGVVFEILGHTRQHIAGNWKFYSENTKDPYHASLLHLFHATFNLYRSTQEGESITNNDVHSVLWARNSNEDADALEDMKKDKLRTLKTGEYELADMSLLAGKQEFDDGITLVILSLFPSLVVQQIQNTLAFRQILPKNENEFELVWTFFGYADDTEEMRNYRLKQFNLIGPGGMISMEDGESTELCQKAIVRDGAYNNVIQMAGTAAQGDNHLVTEGLIRGLWKGYREIMDF